MLPAEANLPWLSAVSLLVLTAVRVKLRICKEKTSTSEKKLQLTLCASPHLCVARGGDIRALRTGFLPGLVEEVKSPLASARPWGWEGWRSRAGRGALNPGAALGQPPR